MWWRCMAWLAMAACVSAVNGQELFDLTISGAAPSRAERTADELRVEDATGKLTVYQRDRRYDTTDGMYVGYRSVSARQVIRWPVSGRGRMQLATDMPGAPVTFRASQMEIVPRAAAGPPRGVDVTAQTAYRLVPTAPAAPAGSLSVTDERRLALRSRTAPAAQVWRFTPLGGGLVRLHSDAWGPEWSLAGHPEDAPRLERTSDALDQLWRIVPAPGGAGEVGLVNVGMEPGVLAYHDTGHLAVKPRGWGVGYNWRLTVVSAALPPQYTQYRFVTQEVRPRPALAPAKVELRNQHAKELWVLLYDRLRTSGEVIKIPPAMAVTTALERDAGATIVEIYERVLPNGVVRREEIVSQVPAATRYDLSVYEVIAQSVAIDRTVPGGKLEDVQYAPRSIGWFELPPGEQLGDDTIDVYAAANAQQNPGQVRRLDPKAWQAAPKAADPVESLLEQFQRKSSR
ncbi:MAG: hypothetical protein AB7F89_26705 [Pirellulaceae bacterium]